MVDCRSYSCIYEAAASDERKLPMWPVRFGDVPSSLMLEANTSNM